ncbi:zinc finger protein required for cell viability [Suhomyces tanzawaensis NRRL Y-17324]|uniref:Zinc finger protein required for cell viability n=1 Tax=Suhomyces tanzawaensis NRRL Y-17324 TaxID=984487 RepID=A0A1E4SQM4_9ASCO|nr:zinc finger protein required for cell viability [Suhomyces tanzawaensis NRRL Y-17324]ODV81712.1 zinc finger protein required for cell viability [Suhomyces tanzawaensis NRRL Y-17324]
MSSVVYYKFLHQKNKSVIHFDGTAINVFDLKREIILQNQLGAGNDFILRLFHSEQPDLEYELDQDVIPRSSFVLAKRSPCNFKGGRFGNASRYISGKPRVNRKVINNATASAGSQAVRTEQAPLDENMSEEDRIKMMFESQDNVWAQAQDELATHKMVYNKPGQAKAEDLPPPGYICYRCGKKDHWIKNCSTNTDPTFEGKKILRTTGIPKSYLKTISKEELDRRVETEGLTTNENGDMVDKDGNAILVTEDGGYAIAMADSKTWLSYQEKQQNAALKAKQEFEQKIVECAVGENRLEFLNPLSSTRHLLKSPIVMTPCCRDKASLRKLTNFNYNQAELEQTLIENDFHCPNCGKEDIYIDSFISNQELEEELHEYIKQKQTELGIEDPEASLKRAAEEDGDDPDSKRQRTDLPIRPDMFGPPGMAPFMPGMPMPGMPGIPYPNGVPMFMPPVPMPPQNGNGESNGTN